MKLVTDRAVIESLDAEPISDPEILGQLEDPSLLSEVTKAALAPIAVGETLLQMGSGFAGALPGVAAGLYNVATGGEFAPAFKSVQDFYTYEPRSEYGKELSGAVGELFHKYSQGVDSLAEKTPGGPLAQTIVKTLGEAVPVVAPFAPRVLRRGPAESRPVTDRATVEALESKKAAEASIDQTKAITDDAVLRDLYGAEEIKGGTQVNTGLVTQAKVLTDNRAGGLVEPIEVGDGKLYSGLPVDQANRTIKFANEKLQDALGIPEKGVTIEGGVINSKPGPLAAFRSPSELVKQHPELKPYKERADRAQIEMDTLRDAFGRRLEYVDKQLGGTILDRAPNLGRAYKENKNLLNEILLAGDFAGKRFSAKELIEQFSAPDNVIKAYVGIRSAYDRALAMANKTRELRGKEPVAKREGYIPHFFHDYFILANGEILVSAKTLREAVSMANDVARSGVEVQIVPKQMRFEGEATQAAIVGDATYFKLREGLEEAFSMSAEQAKALLEDVARMRGRSRVIGNFFQRKGALGWEKNLDYAHRHYFNMISRYVALDKFKASTISGFERRYGSFDKEHKGMAKYIKDYVNDINGVPTRVEELMDGAIQNTPGFSQFAKTYLGERPSLELASSATNAVAIAKLGLYNVSAALVNGSQALMSQALLTPKWFALGAARAAKVTTELAKRKVGAGGEVTPDIGILRQLDVPIQQGLEGSGFSAFNKAGRLFRVSTAFFRGVEFELRASTALGAYYKGLSEGMSKPQALEYARDINRRVNFDYSTADSPSFLRRSGPAGQVLFQFKKFPIKAMEFMGNLKGAENARFWIPFVLIAGYYGFPGIEALNNTVKGMFGIDLQLESKNYLIKWAGEDKDKKAIAKTIFYGAFANDALGGIDLSRRVGGGDFIPSDAGDLLGPFFSSAVRATQMAAGEHWVEALREIATAPGNLAIALRNDGEITNPWDRDRLSVKLDTRGRILRSLGFGTAKESIERDAAKVIRYNESRQRLEEKKAIDMFIRGYIAKRSEVIDRAIDRFAELGMSEGTAERIKEEMKKKGMPVSEREFQNLSKRGRARQAEVMEFAR